MFRDASAATLILGVAWAVTIPAQSPVAEWPQLHGAARNGTVRAPIPRGAALTVAWRVPLASGGAGIAIAGDHVFTIGSAGGRDILFAVDAASGREAWRTVLGETHVDAVNGPGGTPVVAGDVIVTVSSRCQLQAVSSQSHAIAWSQDFPAAYQTRFAKRGGCNMSPVVAGGRVILTTGATTGPKLAAFDVATGQPAGTAELPDTISLASGWMDGEGGHLYGFGGQSNEFLTCVDATTGQVKWTSRIYRGHLALAGDVLVVLSESSGLLRLVAADAAGYRELSRAEVLTPGARTGVPPSNAGGRIFVRNLDELVADSVR